MLVMHCLFLFKQKTAYERRISDWSSDVCSSDLAPRHRRRGRRDGSSSAETSPSHLLLELGDRRIDIIDAEPEMVETEMRFAPGSADFPAEPFQRPAARAWRRPRRRWPLIPYR